MFAKVLRECTENVRRVNVEYACAACDENVRDVRMCHDVKVACMYVKCTRKSLNVGECEGMYRNVLGQKCHTFWAKKPIHPAGGQRSSVEGQRSSSL